MESSTQESNPISTPETDQEPILDSEPSSDVVPEPIPVDVEAKKNKKKKSSKKEKKESDRLQAELDEATAALETIQQENEALKDKSLRALAELENFKRRKEQEKQDFLKYANEKFVLELIPALDSFDMATSQVEQGNEAGLKEGFVLIHKQLRDILRKLGVEAIDALNQPFDPNLHQAVSRESHSDLDENIVVKEMQVGYRLNDRVIRPSMVIVSQK